MLKTHYPRFLLGLPLARNDIPVFIYHDVEEAAFARDLAFLKRNGYRTLSLGEFLALRASKGRGRRGGKHVLLTFDDARSSFYDVALPVLRAFDARATLFVPTYWMNDSTPDDARVFMTWPQVRACAESGLVDVQSHTHRHALVFTSPRLVGFASPGLLARYDIYDWPMRNHRHGDCLGRPPLGAPIYRACPLLSASHRYLEDPQLTDACTNLVQRSGGLDFFSRPDWPARLAQEHERHSSRFRGEVMSSRAFDALIASDFELAREQFQQHLGYAPTSLAYPWMLGSTLSLTHAKRHGLDCAFGVALDYGRARKRNLPLPVFGRLKSDWLPLLPGRGRANIVSIAARKLVGFADIQHLAH